MTTALDFPVPVSFTLVRKSGSPQLVRADGGDHYRLKGPSVASASWSGPQPAELWHHHNTGNGWLWRKLAEFSRGGERLSGSAQKRGNPWSYTFVLLRLHRTWRKITGECLRFSRPSPPQGGGVGGGVQESAEHPVLRSYRVTPRGSSDWRRALPHAAGGRVYAVDYGARYRLCSVLVHLLVGFGAVCGPNCASRGYAGAVECGRTSWREALFSDRFRFLRRRGRGGGHLSPVNQRGGVA